MNGYKKYIIVGAGYFAFFLLMLVISLAITFDPNLLKPMLKNQARQANFNLAVDDISFVPIMGLRFRRLSLSPMNSAALPITFDELTLKTSLARLPGLIAAAGSNRPPPLDLGFSARIDKGKVDGKIDQTKNSFYLILKVADLPLDKINVAQYYFPDMILSGTARADIELDIRELNKTDSWSGGVNLAIESPGFSDFQYGPVKVAGVNMDKGFVNVIIKNGVIEIKNIKFEGQDLPMDLTGTVALKSPLGRSIIDLKGKIPYSEDYKNRMPLITAMIPSPQEYAFHETLSTLVPGI